MTLRWASASDIERLEILAELDSARIPAPPLLLGFVGEDLWAARSLSTGRHIADPFRPSAEVARLLAERGRQLTVPERRRFRRLAAAGAKALSASRPLSAEKPANP